MSETDVTNLLRTFYDELHAAYGPQNWWPADSPQEVVVGAILTQNTAWTNVEKAIASLKNSRCLDLRRIAAMNTHKLAEMIRSAGTYRVKARRLQAFAQWLVDRHDGDLARALSGDLSAVRRELLALPGIGPETADAILLYAGGRRSFVVDAYTRRVLRRHYIIDGVAFYADVKALFEAALPADVQTYNECHALLVELAKRHCRGQAVCEGCPLERFRHDGGL